MTALPHGIDEAIADAISDSVAHPLGRHFRVTAITPSVDKGDDFVRLTIETLHVGILGMHVVSERTTFLPLDDEPQGMRDRLRARIDGIRAETDAAIGFSEIGHAAHAVDVVTAHMIRAGGPLREHALDMINDSSRTLGENGNAPVLNAAARVPFPMPDAPDHDPLRPGPPPEAGHGSLALLVEPYADLGAGFTWDSGEPGNVLDHALEIERAMPETLARALHGRPLSDLVVHPALPPHAIIRDVATGDGTVRVRLERRDEPLASVLDPADLGSPTLLDGTPIRFEAL